jgi:acyl-coenzyme A thioesterase PaaI-like protein
MKLPEGADEALTVREGDYCFGCGPRNPIGLKLDFRMVDGRAETTYVPRREHEGLVGIIHGGLIGLVLDEAMAKLLHMKGIEALTCEITVRLRRVVRAGDRLRITALLASDRRRLLELEASAVDDGGQEVAGARAKFLRVGAGAT